MINIKGHLSMMLIIMILLTSCDEKGNIEEYEVKSEDGTILIKGYFKDKKRDGAWSYFDESGQILMQKSYHNQALVLVEYFNDSGLVYRIRNYKDGSHERIAFGIEKATSGGEYIFNEKCSTCHRVKEDFVAESMLNIINKNDEMSATDFLKLYDKSGNNSKSLHKQIELSELEVQDILNFIAEIQ